MSIGKAVEQFIWMEKSKERIPKWISVKKVFVGLVGGMC